jgi:hypothetical protein
MFQPNMVSWSDYQGVEGFGQASQSDVDSLNKALTVGQTRDPPAVVAGDGFSLRVESLEKTLVNTTYRMKHVLFWKGIPKKPAYNTVEEYNELSSYGQNPDALWVDEGDLPEEDDSTYERKHSYVKYIGTTRRVTHVATVINPAHGPIVAQEGINGTMHLLKGLERGLFYGDSSLSALQFDGMQKLITDNSPTANIIDLRGLPLSEDNLTDGALTVQAAPNYGIPTDLHLNPMVHADLCKTFFPKERTNPGFQNGWAGGDLMGWRSPAGDVRFNPNVFITDGGAPTAAVGDAAKRPATPTVSTGNTTPAYASSQFGADDAGDYYYRIQACNRYGRSAAVHLVAGPTAVTVAAGDEVTWGMTPGSSVSVGWYEIFRSKVGGAALSDRLILRVANAAGTGEQTLRDFNDFLPYCSSGFLFEQTPEAMYFKQLAPMIKVPLAIIDLSVRWIQALYGVPVLAAPRKMVLFNNIGRATGYVGTP